MFRFSGRALRASALLVLTAGLAACGGEETTSGTGGASGACAQEDPVRIGVVLPLSGPLAQGGAYAKAGYDVAVEDVNAAGGIEALDGRCLELVYGDHQADPARAAQVTTQLVQRDRVVALTGSYTSPTGLTGSAAADRLGVPWLQTLGSVNEITERGLENVFRNKYNVADNAVAAFEILDFLGEESGKEVTRVGLMYENSAYGKGGAEAMKALAPERGYEIVADVSFATGTPNLSSQVSRVKSSGAQVVVAFDYEPDTVVLLKNMNTLDYKVPYIAPGGGILGKAVPGLGEVSNGVIAIGGYYKDLETPGNEKVGPKLEQAAEAPPNDDVAYCYTGIWLLKNAIEAAGSDDPAQIREALANLQVSEGPAMIVPAESGSFGFDERGQITGLQQIGMQLQDGEFKTFYPDKYATGKLNARTAFTR